MRYMIIFYLCIFSTSFITGQSIDQKLIGVSNGDVTASGLQLQWSIGETFIAFQATEFGLLTEGFIQPFLGDSPAITNSPINREFVFETYPNPVSRDLTMKFEEPNEASINVSVFNFIGQSVFDEIIPMGTLQQDLDMAALPDGIYIIRLYSPQMEFRASVKILKAKG